MIEFIKHHARSQIFSAAPPPASCGAVIKALEIVEREPERRKQLWENTEYMKRELDRLGFDTPHDRRRRRRRHVLLRRH